MKVIFKIIAIPFVIALTVFVSVMDFLITLSGSVLMVVSSLIGIGGILTLAMGYGMYAGIGLLVMAFLLSPYGLLAVLEWIVGLFDGLNCSLKVFITS